MCYTDLHNYTLSCFLPFLHTFLLSYITMPSAITKHNTLSSYFFANFNFDTNDDIDDFDETFNYEKGAPYIHKWPFRPDMKVYTKGIGGLLIEVYLDHAKRTYNILENDIVVIEEKTPHALQRKLYDAGYVTYNTNSWSSLWVTNCGDVYVLAKDLNHKYAERHGLRLKEKIRKDIPSC